MFTTRGRMTVGTTARRGRRGRALGLAALLLVAGCDSAEERAQGHFDNAIELLAEGESVKARVELRNALQLNPEMTRAHLELGKIREEEQKIGAALKHFRTVTELDPSLYEGHLRLGQIMLAIGDLEKAQTASKAAFQLAPDNVDVLALRSATAFRVGDFETARMTLDDAFAIDDSHPQLFLLRAALQRAPDETPAPEDESIDEQDNLAQDGASGADGSGIDAPDDAERTEMLATIEDGLARNPDDLGLALARVSLLARLGREDEARAALVDTVGRHPDNVALRENLIREQLRVGDLDGAEANLRHLATQEPGNTDRVLDILRVVIRRDGVEAGLAEIERGMAASDDPGLELELIKARTSLLVQNDRRAEAERTLREAVESLGDTSEADEVRVALAQLLIADGDRTAGEALLVEVLEDDGANAGALALRGQLLIRDQDYDAAIADLRKAVTEDPDNVAVLQLLAVAHRRNGNRQLAGERLGDAMEASGNATGPVLDYARHLAREGKAGFAVQIVEDALGARPGDRQLLQALANLHLRQGDWVAAEEVSERLAALDDGGALSANVLAAAKAGRRDFEGSLEALRRVTGDDDRKAAGQNLEALVIAKARAGQEAQARKLIEDRLAEAPQDPAALRLKAAITLSDGGTAAAIDHLEQAIAAGPDEARSYLALARLQGATGEAAAARGTLEQGVERTGSTGLRMALATVVERMGDIDEAIVLYRQVLEAQPGFDVAANNLASLISDGDPTPEALDEAFRAAKRLRGSEVPQYQDTYGWILHLRGDSRAALPALESAALGLPEHPIVQYHLGAVLAELGETERARAALARAIDLAGDSAMPQVVKARAVLESLPAGE